jgi:23S rRNA (adenine2503-C2)-methyltransferase
MNILPSADIYLYDLSQKQLTDLLAGWGYSAYHAGLVWSALYQQMASSVEEMVDIRPDLRQRLAAATHLTPLVTQQETISQDGTHKYLLRLADGQLIETVLMPFRGRYTACISTQSGCAMGCVFCATGQMGFIRHLTPGEIVAQVIHVQRVLRQMGQTLRNLVLMGMGEPLHNYDNSMTALDILMDHKGQAIAPRHITLSTVGVIPGIRRLADENRPFHLAVSLHAATDAGRMALVPPAKKWPLADLIDACRYYAQKRGRRIFFEWALIAGQNDTPEQAHAVGQLLTGLNAHVNLIPLNPTNGYEGEPSDAAAIRQFQHILTSYNLPSTVRQRRGIEIDAGCGQLRSRWAETMKQRASGIQITQT